MAAVGQNFAAGASPVMTVAEVCDYLGIPRATIYRLIQDRKIPWFRLSRHYRFNREEIDPWLRAQEARPSAPARPGPQRYG